MSKSLKAALLSAFLFPGSGHFLLKKYVRGGLLAGVAMLCMYILISTTVKVAQEISAKILAGEIPLDVSNITQEMSKQMGVSGIQPANYATYLLVICWLAGIADSYRVGRLQDKEDSCDDQKEHKGKYS